MPALLLYKKLLSRRRACSNASLLLAVFVLAFSPVLSACGTDAFSTDDKETVPDTIIVEDGEDSASVSVQGDNTNETAPDTTVINGSETLTGPYKAFLEIMARRESVSRTETGADGFIYNLDRGLLTVSDQDGTEFWRSDEGWWIDDFRLGDVDGDGVQDFVYSLWKSYRFGEAHPSRMENDDERVRNHLFVYTALPGRVKALWGSSDLPRPIYSFELDPSGRVTPVSSGMQLITYEGEYRDDFTQTTPVKHIYTWQGWGFVPD